MTSTTSGPGEKNAALLFATNHARVANHKNYLCLTRKEVLFMPYHGPPTEQASKSKSLLCRNSQMGFYAQGHSQQFLNHNCRSDL